MSIKQFIQQENINMIWEVISDEEIFQFLSRDIQVKVHNLFINNIQGFFETERQKSGSLVDINKKYILLILNYIKKNYPIEPQKIKIHGEPVKELITYEEISNDRKSQFEKDYIRRQEEFEDSMTLKAPPPPEFSDRNSDKPIKEMDRILKEMQAQRNYEVEQINRNYTNTSQVDNWLKPQETSLKNEKNFKQESYESQNTQNNNKFKYLNELDQNFNIKKNVSFSKYDEINTFSVEDDEDDNIFLKLKKVKNEKNEDLNLKIDEPKMPEEKVNPNDNRILELEKNVNILNKKIDIIIDLLSNKKI